MVYGVSASTPRFPPVMVWLSPNGRSRKGKGGGDNFP